MEIGVAPRCARSTPVQCTPTIMSLSREEGGRGGTGGGKGGSTLCRIHTCAVHTHNQASVEGRGGTGEGKGGSMLCRIHTCAVHTHNQASVEGRGGKREYRWG